VNHGNGLPSSLRLDLDSSQRRKPHPLAVASHYTIKNDVTLQVGPCELFLPEIPKNHLQLVVTSPPYNIGKRYERGRKLTIEQYVDEQRTAIKLCAERLRPEGSICWQIGNHVTDNEVVPIDVMLYPVFREVGLVLRNRIIWHFEHGLHCGRRLSGRYETIMWFTWPGQRYVFNLDAIRVPQKYPGKKYFKGPKAGQYSANPLGKNPGDVWVIPNVKHNHVEKTNHPCQFPVELVERLVLALSNPGDLVLDPYIGSGSTAVAALLHNRRSAGADIVPEYIDRAKERVQMAAEGTLRTRPMHRPVYKPQGSITVAPWHKSNQPDLPLTPVETLND